MPKKLFKTERVPKPIRKQQLEQFEIERESVEAHIAEARRIIREMLLRDSKILVMDLSQGGFDPSRVQDDRLVGLVRERQFGGGRITHGQIMRHMLGFAPDDPRVTIWDVANDPNRSDLPYPDAWDAWLTTGGPAMPSELDEGNETQNTHWLNRATHAMEALREARVPGKVVCLGSQLWERKAGATVGRYKPQREFGTVRMNATEAGQGIQMLAGFWDEEGHVDISASHSEGVTTPAPRPNVEVIAFNDYSPWQGFAHPLREGQTVAEADADDELIVSIQNHPELLAIYLEILRYLRGEKMVEEGLEPAAMLFRNTPRARQSWLNFLKLVGRRTQKRRS